MSYQETFPDLVDAISVIDRMIDEQGNNAEGEAWGTVRGELLRRGAILQRKAEPAKPETVDDMIAAIRNGVEDGDALVYMLHVLAREVERLRPYAVACGADR